jgi:hypothetical protein
MFDLYFYSALSAYATYYNDINDYSCYKLLLDRSDNREDIINDIFAKYKIYNGRIINEYINYFHVCKKYFN